MKARLTAELLQQYSAALRRTTFSLERSGEMALEVELQNAAVVDAAARLDFNDEPARFLAALAQFRETRK